MIRLEPKTFLGDREKRWASDDLCVDLSHYAAGCALGAHRHDRAFFCFMLDGAYEERADGFREVLHPGSLVYHSAGCEHSNEWFERGRCIHLEFGPSFGEGMKAVSPPNPVFQLKGARAADLARTVHRELLHTDTASGIAFEGLALLLLAETVRDATRESAAPRWLRTVHDRLQDEYAAVPSLRRMAEEVGVHPSYLASSFHKHHGLTVGEFVRLRRIERAQELLAKTDQPLGEIALALGFSDQSHFCRTFKQKTGHAPLEYRRLFCPALQPRSTN